MTLGVRPENPRVTHEEMAWDLRRLARISRFDRAETLLVGTQVAGEAAPLAPGGSVLHHSALTWPRRIQDISHYSSRDLHLLPL